LILFSTGLAVTRRNLVHAILQMCQALELDTLVEGVETEDQLSVLRELGARVIQGFYFSRPLPHGAIDGYLRAQYSPADT